MSRAGRHSALVAAAMLALLPSASADWMKMNPPPDVDKATHGHVGQPTCWLAAAANMLAGAGYGVGATVQQRADNIYNQLVAHYGSGSGGWTDTAISWWLGSANNTWPANPYDVVTVYGNKSPKYPWANANGAQFIGNELRRCQFVGLSISWPVAGSQIGEGGHAIAAWGDEGGSGNLTANPAQVKVTDSDKDAGGDVQTYNYDAYTNPNPGGANEGNGWYIDYSNNHPYIKHIVTLCPTDDPGDYTQTQKVTGSYKIHQNNQSASATDLHYDVGTDVDILSYWTDIDWPTNNAPVITEEGDPPRNLDVMWNLADNPVPYCTWITITTEFVVPTWNAIEYSNVYFTYPFPGPFFPGFRWALMTPTAPDPDAPNVTGGYVVGSFELYTEPGRQVPIGEYRLQHEYDYDQDPEFHDFMLENRSTQYYYVGNFRFGHSYGLLDDEALWQFGEWLEEYPGIEPLVPGMPFFLQLQWPGLLPYPPADDYRVGDMNCDGRVNAGDIPPFVLALTDPSGYAQQYPNCNRERGDVNGDGLFNAGDIPAFVNLLTGGG